MEIEMDAKLDSTLNEFKKIDRLLSLLKKRKMPCTLPSLENFVGLFNRDVFLALLELVPNTIEMRGNSFSANEEICVKPPGASAAKETARVKSARSQLEAFLKKSILHYWTRVGQVSEQGLTKKWKDYNAIGGIAKNIDPSDLVDLGTDGEAYNINEIFSLDYVNMVLHGKDPPASSSKKATDNITTSNKDIIKQLVGEEEPSHGHPKIDLLQDDDGQSTCISLTQRSYATDDKHASLYNQLECRNNAEYILQSMKSLPFYRDQLIYYTKYDSKEAIYLPLERALPPQLTQAIQRNLGIDVTTGLYRHQALAIDALRNGQHLALATETSSGKSLVYNLPVVEKVIQDPGSTALYLFPTKALSQDQLRAIHVLTGDGTENAPMRLPVTSSICDGDSDYTVREHVQSKHGANIILTNPDMLHHTIMPQHKSYKRVFEKLRFVIIDESHQYKGTFGAHVSCVLKRLVRICRMYSLEPPQFICCSATISNPRSLFQDLVPLHVLGGIYKLSVIDANLGGTAKGERLFGMWNPPLTEATQAAMTEERERKKEEAETKKKKIEVKRKRKGKKGKGEQESGSGGEDVDGEKEKVAPSDTVPVIHLAALENSKNAARRMMAEAVLVEEEEEIGAYNDDDADMRDFLRSCEDRYRHPVSWTGIYGNKPRYHKKKKDAKGDMNEEEQNEENNQVKNDANSSSRPHKGASPSPKNVIMLKRQRVTEQEKYISERERESPFVEIARLFAYFVALRLRVLCFCGTRRLVEMINRMAQEELKSTYRASHLIDRVASYRGGYTAETRREIEAGLFGGSLLGVLATCALELGVDVGNLDVTLHLGFPGSYSSLWQQAGRAGRGGRPSLSIMVCFDSPVEQFFARNPDKLFNTAIEGVVLGTDNPFVLRGHLLCAAHEAALNSEQLVMNGLMDEKLWGKSYVETALGLVGGKNLKVTSKLALRNLMAASNEMRSYDHLTHASFEDISKVRQYELTFGFAAGTSSMKESLFTTPSRSVNLRLIDPISIDIVDTTRNTLEGGKVIDCMTYSRAFFEAFPGSVFYYQAKQYTITQLDLASKRAYCHPTRVDYTTTALNDTIVTIIHEESQQNILNDNHHHGDLNGEGTISTNNNTVTNSGLKGTGHSCLSYGVVSVVKKVSGFIKRSIKTRELLDEGEFNLPPLEMQTQAVWIDLPLYIKREVERQGFDISGALHAANHAFCAVAAIESLCDVGDLDCEHFGTMSVYSGAQPRRMLMYDRRPGGLGICEALVAAKDGTLRGAHNILVSCDCSSAKGCPACLLDSRCSHYNENLSKEGAICLLKMLVDDMQESNSLECTELTESVDYPNTNSAHGAGCGCATGGDDMHVIAEEGMSSPLREDAVDSKDSDSADTLTPRQLRRLRLKRQARFRDNHSARGLFITNGWSEAVDETTT